MRSIAGSGNFQCRRNTEFLAGLHVGLRIITPVSFIKVHSKEIAGIVLEQWIDANRMFTGQVTVDHLIGKRACQTLVAIATLDTWLLADTDSPFVGTSGCVP